MVATTRLGLYGGPRSPYGVFGAPGVSITETLTDSMTTADAETQLAPGSSWSPLAGDYLIAHVGVRGPTLRADNGDPGNGGTWTLLAEINDTQGQINASVYGYSVITGFTGTPNIDLTASDDAAVQFIRITANRYSAGYTVVLDANTSADVGATDDATPTVNLTYTNADIVVGVATHRDVGSHSFTQGSNYTANVLNTTSASGGGEDVSVSSEYDLTPGASAVTVDGTLAASHDWIMWAAAFYEADPASVSAVVVDEYAQTVAQATATVTGSGTLSYEYRSGGAGSWTTVPVQHHDDYAGGEIVSWLGGLPENTSLELRTDMNGNASYATSASFTSLTQPTTMGTAHYLGARPVVFWSYPDSGNRVTGETSDAVQHGFYGDQVSIAFDANSTGLTFLDNVDAETNSPNQIYLYTLLNEIRHDGGTGGPDGEPLAETGVNHLLSVTADVTEFHTYAQSTGANYSEDIFLHQTSKTVANRLSSDDGDKWVMEPADTTWQALQRKLIIKRYLTYAGAGVTSTRRFTGIAWDNVDVRPNRSTTTSVEYGTTGKSATYRADVSTQLDYLMATGIRMIGNVIGDIENGGDYEVEHVAVHLDGAFLEAILRGYSGHHSPAQIEENWLGIERLRDADGNPTTGFTYPADYELWLVGQTSDTTTAATSSGLEAQIEAVWAAWGMVVDTSRSRVFHRGADSDSGGYDRLREVDAWDTDTGDPTADRTFDTSSGTTPDGIWKRTFDNGTLYYNVSTTSKSSTDSGVGTLGAREFIFVSSSGVVMFQGLQRIEDGIGPSMAAGLNGLLQR